MSTSSTDDEEDLMALWLSRINSSHWSNRNESMYDDFDELYDVPPGIIVLLSICYGSISFLAVVGNSLVMWIVATSRRMQNVTNCFIANLALSDIVIGLFAIPFQFQAALLQRWNLPHFMCSFCPFVRILCVNVSVFSLTAIAVDRYRAILAPLSARPSKLTAKIIIACIWVLAGALAAPIAVALRVIMVPESNIDGRLPLKPFCHNENMSKNSMLTYRALLGFLQYLTPLSIISYVYARMALRLWGSKAPGNAEDSRDANIMRNKKKVIKMLVIVVALFALCWLPLQTYNVLQYIFPKINEYRYINIIWFCCDWLAMSNSCCNPFIYGIYNEKFKKEFQQRCPFKPRTWFANSTAGELALDKTRSTRTSTRYNWGRPSSSRCPMNATFRRREPTSESSLDEDVKNRENTSVECCSLNEQTNRCVASETSRCGARLYVSTSSRHKRTHDLATRQLCL